MPSQPNTAEKPARWDEARCASLRVDDLWSLADLRHHSDLRVIVDGDRAWVSWQPGSDIIALELPRRILAREGVVLFVERDGQWYRPGERLPAFDVPFRDGTAGTRLDQLVVPEKVQAHRPDQGVSDLLSIRLVHDDGEGKGLRLATALRCSLRALSAWADTATSSRLSLLQGAWRGAASDQDAEAFVLGPAGALPLLRDGARYWGADLLVPIGHRALPDLPEAAIRGIVGAGPGELVVLDENGFELIARQAIRPLTRAGVRLAADGPNASRPDQGGQT